MKESLDYIATTLPESDSRYKRNPAQLRYAESIEDALSQGVGHLHCIEGDTGIGKTLAYLLPLARWVAGQRKTKRQVVLSTFTRTLQRQIVLEENQTLVNRFLASHGVGSLKFAVRMGRGNYVSVDRLLLALDANTLDEVIADKSRGQHERSLAQWAKSTEGCLLELDDEAFPDGIGKSDIALTQWEPLPDVLADQFAAARQADILVVNHALLVNDLVGRGAIIGQDGVETAVLLDEAEHFPDVAEKCLSHRLSFAGIARAARHLGYKTTAERWQTLFDTSASERLADHAVTVPDGQRDVLASALTSIRRTPHNATPETADEREWAFIRETAGALHQRLKRGDKNMVMSYSPVRGMPSLVYSRDEAGRCLRNGMGERITIMTSATLSDMTDSGTQPTYRYLLNRLAISQSDPCIGIMRRHAALKFGKLSFRVYPDMPQPLKETEDRYRLTDAFARQAVGHILEGTTGRVLVLCSSYADVAALAEVWPDRHRARLVTHPSGAVVNDVAVNMGKQGVLLTPAGWEGLSPERDGVAFWSRVVILRNPRAIHNPVDELLLANSLRKRGHDSMMARHKAGNILYAKQHTKTLHRLRQGIGRAIRHPDDECEIVFLDPRFANSDGVGKGAAIRGLAVAIPKRFRARYASSRRPRKKKAAIVL